jgi:hypothetical protein
MKNFLACICCLIATLLLSGVVNGQNIAINSDGSLPDASAMLDITSTAKGFLAPRMTTTEQNAIPLPAKGLLIFNTTDNFFRVNTGTPVTPVWSTLGATFTGWSLTGNAATNSSTNFLGTTDNVSLLFRTNNINRMLLDSLGRVAIGTTTLNVANPERFLVDAGATSSVNAIVGKGNINNYLQLNIQNNSAGSFASSDVVATANNGDESSNFVDMGINGGGNSSNIMGTANDAYLYNLGQNLFIGAGTSGKSLLFLTGGTDSASNERMRIDGSGNVGIGVANPAYKLQINASSNPLKLVGLQTGANTDSILTMLNGVVRKLHPSAIITASSNAWGLLGNASTNPSSNFIGTTDAQALVIKENGTQVGRFEANSIALGNGAAVNNATHSYAFGSGAGISFGKTASMAIGNASSATSDSALAIGIGATTTASNAFSLGTASSANSYNSFAIGRTASTAFNISEGFAIGYGATVNSTSAMAIGRQASTAFNTPSAIAIGTTAVSNSTNAIAIGTGATTGFSLTNPIAIGVNSLANGNNSVAIGNGASVGPLANTTVIGSGATATLAASNSTALGAHTAITKANEIILGDMTNGALSVGIGTENFSGTNREKLLVDAGTTTSVNAIVGKGTIDGYLQLNIQNNSAGTNSSSDVVATANNGSETTNYVDMGVNGGNYNGGFMGVANDAYLYNMGQNLLIGTGAASKSLVFLTGGTSQATNERMRIDGTGNVGIANIAPTQKLDITGNLRLSGAFMPGNDPGTSGYYLKSLGAGVAPVWSDISTVVNTNAWNQGGNTLAVIKNLGTISNHDLPFITNNTEKMRLSVAGDLAIGATTFNGTNPEQLLVDAGTTTSVNAIVGKGSINNYLQLNIQNNSAGTAASSDVVATANNGSETTNYVDMGINGGGNTSGILGTANDAYLYNMGMNFMIGTGSSGKHLMFLTGGTDSTANERMRIDGNGNVGIGVRSPGTKLQVNATSNPLSLGGLQTGTSTDSVLTVLNGIVKMVHPSIMGASTSWALVGNTGSNTSKLGTTGNFDLPVITNNTTKMTIKSNGNIGIGSTDFDASEPEKLLVDGGTSASSNLIGAFADVNKYVQIGVQNLNPGNFASSDIVATADNGTNTTNYIDMGINSSGYANNASNILNRSNVGYVYTNATADFFIGNGAPNEDLILFTNNGPAGNTTANGFEAMRIDGNGNVGIGGTSRANNGTKTVNAEKLVVQGNIVPRTSGNGTIGTSTYKWNAVYATNGTIQTSDQRLKTGIINLKYGLKEVLALRPVSFFWKETPGTNKKVGLIAQEVRKIIPEVVVGDEQKENLGLNYAELVPVLINAVKEQQKQIDELKQIVEKLQNAKK